MQSDYKFSDENDLSNFVKALIWTHQNQRNNGSELYGLGQWVNRKSDWDSAHWLSFVTQCSYKNKFVIRNRLIMSHLMLEHKNSIWLIRERP